MIGDRAAGWNDWPVARACCLISRIHAVAKAYLEQALTLDRQIGSPLGEATALCNLGITAERQGDYAAAREYLNQSLELYRQMGLPIPPALQLALENLPAEP